MNCTKCGKKNADNSLFCGFCGSPLNTPEQSTSEEDEERRLYGPPQEPKPQAVEAEEPVPRRAPRHAKKEPPRSEEASDSEEEADGPEKIVIQPPIPPRPQFRDELPLDTDDGEYGEEVDIPLPEEAPDFADDGMMDDPLARPLLDKPVELRVKHPPQLTRTSTPVKPRAATGARRVNTVVPPRAPDPEDMFLEDEAEDDLADFAREYLDDYRYEETERGNFFVRHIRGFVCLILLAIVTLIVGYWLLFGSGQRVLGQLYISGNPATYVELGGEADAAGNYEEAGAYYLRALELDPSDRTTAINAANAYIRAGNSGRAATALEYLIAIDPYDIAPYTTLKQLYPDPASRPQSVSQLLQQGYQNTGDASLLD